MSHHLADLLQQWLPTRDETEWVLGSVTEIHGSSYRKPGAMMLFSGMGQQLGLLSGGCLEADLMRHARQVMASGQAQSITYDMEEEESVAWQLGIGCGGRITIELTPVHAGNGYLQLDQLLGALQRRQPGCYALALGGNESGAEARLFSLTDTPAPLQPCDRSRVVTWQARRWLVVPVKPAPHLLIFGGGIDARPLVTLAAELGWHTTLVDHRSAHARPAYFPRASEIHHCRASELATALLNEIDAAVIMNHNVAMDAEALRALRHARCRYLALLGPRHRCDRVLQQAGIAPSELPAPLASPAGLDIGGELPESIALSILAECHAVLEGRLRPALSSLLPD